MAKDGTAYAGLQDNGELRSRAGGTQFMTHDGDGTFSAVDPDNSNAVYERQPGGRIQVSQRRRPLVAPRRPPTRSSSSTRSRWIRSTSTCSTPATSCGSRTDGGSNWTQVFSLGSSPAGVAYAMSALDLRSQPYGPRSRPGRTRRTSRRRTAAPRFPPRNGGPAADSRHYADHPFTIGPTEGDARVDIKVTWASSTNDWDLELYRQDGSNLVLVKSSANFNPETGVAEESVSVSNPPAGDYIDPRGQLDGDRDVRRSRDVHAAHGDDPVAAPERRLRRLLRHV